VPTLQSRQAVAPLNLPAAHCWAAHEVTPVVAATVHTGQEAHADAPAAEYVFTAQELQEPEPEAVENLPATQVTHCVPPVVSL